MVANCRILPSPTIGVKLGSNDVEIHNSVEVLKSLEEARCSIFEASNSNDISMLSYEGSKKRGILM